MTLKEKIEHDMNPKPIGDPIKRIVVDRNTWLAVNEPGDKWGVAYSHREGTIWADRFDHYIILEELALGGEKAAEAWVFNNAPAQSLCHAFAHDAHLAGARHARAIECAKSEELLEALEKTLEALRSQKGIVDALVAAKLAIARHRAPT